MAKRELTSHQRGIVKRYYEHEGAIVAQRLQEIVGELYLAAAEGRKQDRLWTRAEQALARTKLDPERAGRILAAKDIEGLARLAGEIAG